MLRATEEATSGLSQAVKAQGEMLADASRLQSASAAAAARDAEQARASIQQDLEASRAAVIDVQNALVDTVADPNLLFEQGSAKLRPTFESLLAQLFPEYLRVLFGFKDDIEEVRIEGHTPSEWGSEKGLSAYFNNMALSQERTRAVLEYGLTKTNTPELVVQWGRERITANGLSSSRPRELASGAEDSDASRRVEFRVLMKAKEQLLQIIEPGVK